MSFLGFQGAEWLIILVIVLIIFGPSKLPQLARGLGQAIREFRKASAGLYDEEAGRKEPRGKREMDDETLYRLAEKLGVENRGKSRDELVDEVVRKAREKGLLED
ncbi:MAG: twin-arginine translocase TatA/TatE family subunit [Candidatus Korarchaeota archaeon]|nr:twin-arginine translocase TatA/TatE family subunit [Candidatus Korarchaeota archaeon]